MDGEIMSEEETQLFFEEYINELGLQDNLILNFVTSKVAPTSVIHDPKGGKSRV
jgi:hypothetical protein